VKADPKFEIRIIPISAARETWRAVVSVPRKWSSLPGVQGQGAEGGPWIGGEGNSPATALDALTYAIGRATLGALHQDAVNPERAQGES